MAAFQGQIPLLVGKVGLLCRLMLVLQGSCYLVGKLCLTLFNPMDCSHPGSTVHEVLQTRILEWIVISFSRRYSWIRERTCVSCIARWILYHWATREALFKDDQLYKIDLTLVMMVSSWAVGHFTPVFKNKPHTVRTEGVLEGKETPEFLVSSGLGADKPHLISSDRISSV